MSKILDRILSDYRQHLFEQKPDLELLICYLKTDLWHGPGVQHGSDYPGWSDGVDKLREMLDDVDSLWVNEAFDEWSTINPDTTPEPEDCPWDYHDDGWFEVSRKVVWRSILGELYEYI